MYGPHGTWEGGREKAPAAVYRKVIEAKLKGVNGRNSDNTRIRAELAWGPSTPLRAGMEVTYRWIYDHDVAKHGRGGHRRT